MNVLPLTVNPDSAATGRDRLDNSTVNSDKVLAALQATGDLAYEWHVSAKHVVWLGATQAVFGEKFRLEQLGQIHFFNSLIHQDDAPIRLAALEAHYGGAQAYEAEYRVRRSEGDYVWVHDRGVAEMDRAGQPLVVRGVLRVIQNRKLREVALQRRVNFDELTGHYNRNRLRERLADALKQADRYQSGGAFLVIGIDKMSVINEVYGHDAADTVLIAIGHRLETYTRGSDAIGRIGGDTFGVILNRCAPDHVESVAEKILHICREMPIETRTGSIHVSVSIGGVIFPLLNNSAFDVMAKAEASMHQAKDRGRDCYLIYRPTPEVTSVHKEQMGIGHQVLESMRDHRIIFAYQPVVDTLTDHVAFYEALLRMRAPDGSIIPAGKFIPAIEHVGLTRQVDRYVLDMAIKEMKEHSDLKVAINISGLTVTESTWLRALIHHVQGRRDVAERLVVEITETEAMRDLDESARFVDSVRALGCRVALDDFGAGFTSFKHLKALSVDIVKIDGSYVRNIHNNRENKVFVHSLIDLASTFGLQIIAECIEQPGEALFLRNEGVHYLQGYMFGKPDVNKPWLQSDK